jgi:hypothetical protein
MVQNNAVPDTEVGQNVIHPSDIPTTNVSYHTHILYQEYAAPDTYRVHKLNEINDHNIMQSDNNIPLQASWPPKTSCNPKAEQSTHSHAHIEMDKEYAAPDTYRVHKLNEVHDHNVMPPPRTIGRE